MKTDSVYFPGLNGLRIIAALMVFLAHIESIKNERGMSDVSFARFYAVSGSAGVNLFFCISGFLITFLLLAEKENLGTIRLRDFYIRRILRIWPLYYLLLFLTMLIIPQFVDTSGFFLHYKTNLPSFLLYFFFCPYIANALYSINFLAAVLWSVGVEETFYLIWPLIIKKATNISITTFLLLLFFFISIKGFITFRSFTVTDMKPISNIFDHLRLECMIIGAAFAFLLKTDSPLLKYIKHSAVFIVALSLWLIYLIFGFDLIYQHMHILLAYLLDPLIYSLLCSIIIINVISRENIHSILEHRVPFELGRISYGFYLYHIIGILITFLICEQLGLSQPPGLFITVVAFIITTCLAYISYHGFEQRFLLLKKKFTHIMSGQEAKTIIND